MLLPISIYSECKIQQPPQVNNPVLIWEYANSDLFINDIQNTTLHQFPNSDGQYVFLIKDLTP